MDVDVARLVAYHRWANGESLASLEAIASPPAKAVGLMAHVLGSEECWISRTGRGCEPDDIDAWDKLDLAGLRRGWRDDLPAKWGAFLADPVLSAPMREFSYANYLGDRHPGVVADAILNLMLHSAYHRGQVGQLVRAAGGEPAVTELHRAIRTGALPSAVAAAR